MRVPYAQVNPVDSNFLFVVQPSIQKLVANLGQEALVHLAEEVISTDAYTEKIPGVDEAVQGLEEEFGATVVDRALTEEAKVKSAERCRKRAETDRRTVRTIISPLDCIVLTWSPQIEWIIEFASAPTAHVGAYF